MKMSHLIFVSLVFFIFGVGEIVGENHDLKLIIPQEITLLDNGERSITRDDLLAKPQLIIFANRDSFDIIEETAEVFTYPKNTVWVPNIALAPKWVVRAFIKPALNKTAKKYREQGIRVVYDLDGEWGKGLKVNSEEDGFIVVFYAHIEGVMKVMEKIIAPKSYKSDEAKISLGKEIVASWSLIE